MESQIQNRIIKFLKGIGAYPVKVVLANRTGIPDILCCYQGQFYGFEVKTESGKVTELQKYNIDLIHKAGGKAYVVRSLDEVKKIVGI
jgi:Holliday junction resolvase